MTHAPDDYALVIGIDHYPMWAKGKKSLKGSINDAKDFHAWLASPRGGGLSPDNARLVVSTEKPVSPLQQIIDDEFKIIRERSRGKLRRRFYFYFSGHGHSPAMSQGRQALCLANWSVEDQGAALQLESYLNASVGCLGFEEGIFFLDCCRVREATPLGKSSDLECGDPKLEGKHHVIFYATEHYKPGYEDDTDDARGFFTRALLAILGKGVIEVDDLGKRLSKDVPDLAKPRNQTARTLRYTDREIFLGPPEIPPQPGAVDGAEAGELALLSVSLDTNLTTDTGPDEPPAPLPGEIAVLQGDAVLGTARGSFSARLPLGKYRIRIAHGEAVDSHNIDLKADQDFPFPLPRRVSAAPLSSTIDKREIIPDPIVSASRIPRPRGSEQSIFIAYRTRNGTIDGRFAGELRIERYSTLDEVIADNRTLYPAYEGMYGLHYYHPDGSRQHLSFPVAKGWDTQLFIVEDQGRPILERASIFMQPAGKGFDPGDRLIDAFELALSDLVTGGPGPDPVTLNYLLDGKFRNPLFGLIGAHFLLRELRFATERVAHRYALLNTVIGNMGRLLGEDNPDVIALRALRAQLGGDWPVVDAPTFLPLLAASLSALIEMTADRPEPFDSEFDGAALGLAAESPWTCWWEQPPSTHVLGWNTTVLRHFDIEMHPGPRSDVLKTILVGDNFRVFDTVNGGRRLEAEGSVSNTTMDFRSVKRLATLPDWLVEAMRGAIDQSGRTQQPIDLKRLVRRLGVPRGLLEQAERIVRNEFILDDATPTDTKKATPLRRAAG
jgi:hypothetical protein